MAPESWDLPMGATDRMISGPKNHPDDVDREKEYGPEVIDLPWRRSFLFDEIDRIAAKHGMSLKHL